MAGHSKWAQIKHKKAREDAKRGKVFTKLTREIITAARIGGGDPEKNPRLRQAIQAAKAANMPSDNIQRAIKKGTGELESVFYEEGTFEGYGPGGVAVLVKVLTDNRNRTVSEIRHIFSKHNGNLGESGCVSYLFENRGIIHVAKDSVDEEKLMEAVLEAGAEDMKSEEESTVYEVICAPQDFDAVKSAVAELGAKIEYAEVTMVPQTTVKLSGKQAEQMLKLMSALEDNDDVQAVYANFDISESDMEAFGG
ncbi:MAG: YebC/PmpR family DNA-binding transcriptional regulator [Deltaproteobacteria bacterium]|nr:MAG: YebC/PmpR family DNA-binding transcriptional regulator [Deltaproteobacteria bacterium]